MKRPTELIEKAKGFKSTDPIRVLAEYAVSLEPPRKTVSDDCEDDIWYDGKDWPEKQFEAEVERRKGEEWTHKDGVSECNIIATHGELSWVKYLTGENYVVRNDCLTKRKPVISKAEAWDMLMERSMNSSEVNTIKRDYDIV